MIPRPRPPVQRRYNFISVIFVLGIAGCITSTEVDRRDLEELNRIRASTRESLGIWKGSSSPLGNNCYVIRPDDRNRIYHQQRSGLYELTVIYDGGPRDAFNAAFIPADKPGKPEKVRLADVGKKTGVYIIFDRDDIHLIDTASDRKSLLKNR